MSDDDFLQLYNKCLNDEERDRVVDSYLKARQKEKGTKYNTKSSNQYSWQTIQTQNNKTKREVMRMQLII